MSEIEDLKQKLEVTRKDLNQRIEHNSQLMTKIDHLQQRIVELASHNEKLASHINTINGVIGSLGAVATQLVRLRDVEL